MEVHLPIACSLDANSTNEREKEWRALLESPYLRRDEIADGVRLTFRSSDNMNREAKRLVDLERSCCAWIRWDVIEDDASLTIEATALTDEGINILRSWFGRLK